MDESVKHRQDHYKSLHTQWMIPPHLMKDHHAMTMKFMSILAERDAAIQERNLAVSEKKAAFAERDMAIMQREAAIAERNNAMMGRENEGLEYRGSPAVDCTSAPRCGTPRTPKHLIDAHYNSRDMNISEAIPISAAASETRRRAKAVKSVKPLKKGKKMKTQIPFAKPFEWKEECGEVLSKQVAVSKPPKWPVPCCSCTGVLQQCYKWGKGGWQSACCTTTLSMYPLPVMPNKRHARLGGRKMSGSAFAKLLSRLASEGHDLSTPLDLKDHWAKHGTNRYITIK